MLYATTSIVSDRFARSFALNFASPRAPSLPPITAAELRLSPQIGFSAKRRTKCASA